MPENVLKFIYPWWETTNFVRHFVWQIWQFFRLCGHFIRHVGMSDVSVIACKRSAPPPPNPVVGVRGLVPGNGVLVRQDFSDPDQSLSDGLVVLSCGGSHTECLRDRDHSLHRCLQPQGGTARLLYTAREVVPATGKPAHQSVEDGWRQCSWVLPGSCLNCSLR